MAKAQVQPPSEEKEQGAVQNEEAAEATTAAMSEAQSPEQVADTAVGAAVAPEQAPPAEPIEGYTVQNPYMLLPPTLNYFPQQRKTQPERNYDAGLLWEVLSEDAQADPLTQMIARRLTGKE